MLYFIILILFNFGEAIYYDDYDNFGVEDFDYFENATVIDLSVNSSTPYQDDKAFFGAGIESLPEDITLEDLLSGEGFDLRYTNEQRFQKLRQFRRLFTFYLVGFRLRPAHLVQYGCWCFPRGQLIMGYGQPVDDIDNTCRNHQLCLHCVKMDTNHECDGNMQPYRVFGQIYQNGRRLLCKDPPGSCAWLACQCDVNMVTTIILAALRGYKPMYWRYNPARCNAIDRNHLFEPDQCCGKYPDRFPYHSDEKQCCRGKLFNPDHTECCPTSGEVRRLGEC